MASQCATLVAGTVFISWAVMPLTSVSLAENSPGSKRSLASGRAYPLGEPDRPSRKVGTAEELLAIVRYLDVERSARYQRAGTQTYCNIYACDYCHLAGAYLPRVWWRDPARDLPVKYGETVLELNANALHGWLDEFGDRFGWARAGSLDHLQAAANAGHEAVICARRKILKHPGHIAVVVPESAPHVAERDGGGVHVPLQSQAGRSNVCFSCRPGRWWEGAQFQAYGFWIHA